MTSLLAVGGWTPPVRVPIEDLADRFGLTPMQIKIFRRYHKLGEVGRDPDGSLLDLLRGAVAGLAEELRGREHRVRYVLHARTLPTVVPYPLNPVHQLCREFGLDRATVLAVGHHACASGLLAVDTAARLLDADADPEGLALVLAGEKTFTDEARMVPDTSFFGEGAAACLVSPGGERDRLLSYAVDLRGEFDTDEPEAALEFQRVYSDALGEAIEAAVKAAGLTVDEVDLIIPHNVNRVAWHQVCRRLDFPRERVLLDNVGTLGHVFCADTFLNYRTAREQGLLKPGGIYVMAAAGAGRGATFSAMAFRH